MDGVFSQGMRQRLGLLIAEAIASPLVTSVMIDSFITRLASWTPSGMGDETGVNAAVLALLSRSDLSPIRFERIWRELPRSPESVPRMISLEATPLAVLSEASDWIVASGFIYLRHSLWAIVRHRNASDSLVLAATEAADGFEEERETFTRPPRKPTRWMVSTEAYITYHAETVGIRDTALLLLAECDVLEAESALVTARLL